MSNDKDSSSISCSNKLSHKSKLPGTQGLKITDYSSIHRSIWFLKHTDLCVHEPKKEEIANLTILNFKFSTLKSELQNKEQNCQNNFSKTNWPL